MEATKKKVPIAQFRLDRCLLSADCHCRPGGPRLAMWRMVAIH
jgi:hypothetical protein